MNQDPSLFGRHIDRRTLLETAAAGVFAVGVATACGTTENTPGAQTNASTRPGPATAVQPGLKLRGAILFEPDWDSKVQDDATRTRLAASLASGAVSDISVSFALLQTDSTVGRPNYSSHMDELIAAANPDMTVSVAIGGWGAGIDGWNAAFDKKEGFAKSVADLVAASEQRFGRHVGVVFDCEEEGFPAADLTAIVDQTRKAIGDRKIGVTVPVDWMLDTFDAPALLKAGANSIMPMLYDRYAPTSPNEDAQGKPVSGDIAGGLWIQDGVGAWVKRANGDASKIEPLLPAYGYAYNGAKKAGDRFVEPTGDDDGTVLYPNIPGPITDDLKALTSQAHDANGNWISCLSPAVLKLIFTGLMQRYPTLGTPGYWEATGVTPAHLQAVQQLA
ncbi:MAG TPA: glycoside hydrolase family 18 protein [Patescibacteria group bacterium]|nr:glycoside hydrolase family 18 protein [Patescibacteria group bacterium]